MGDISGAVLYFYAGKLLLRRIRITFIQSLFSMKLHTTFYIHIDFTISIGIRIYQDTYILLFFCSMFFTYACIRMQLSFKYDGLLYFGLCQMFI